MKPLIKQSKTWIVGITALSVLATSVAFASGSSTQKNKNLWRNVTTGAGVVAAHGLLTHNKTQTIVGVAGAAYAGSRYESDRHHQSQASAARKSKERAAHLNRSRISRDKKYYAYNGKVYVYDEHTHARTVVG